MRSLRLVTAAAWLLLVATVALALAVLLAGPVSVGPTVGIGAATATLGVWVDGISVALLALVAVVGVTVAAYARRYLDGEQKAGRFAVALAVISTGMALVVTAASLPVLLVGWVLAGQGLVLALGHRGDPTAVAMARRTRLLLVAADVSLVAALLLLVRAGVPLDRSTLSQTAEALSPAQLSLVALLVMVAGLVRSAQVPAHRWLPETSAAPTPVSAVLHAGLVNGAGLLGVLLWPLLVGAPLVLVLVALVGAATVVVTGLQSRARSDVKGRLATSTSAQMGWMSVQLGTGVPAAALVHVVGHGLYKQSLFLGSGSAVQPFLRHRDAPSVVRPSRAVATAWQVLAAAVAVAIGAAALVTGVLPWHGPGTLLVVVAGAATAATVASRALTGDASLRLGRRLALAAVPAAGLAAYLAVVGAVDRASGSVLVPVAWPVVGGIDLGWVLVAVVLVALLAAVVVDAAVRAGRLPRMRTWGWRSALPPRSARRLGRDAVSVCADAPVSAAERAATRARAATAAALYPPTWSLDSFVATNPLGGLVHLPRHEAFARAAALRGTRVQAPLAWYQALHRHEPVDAADLEAALDQVMAGYRGALSREQMRARVLEPAGTPEVGRGADRLHAPSDGAAREDLVDAETVAFLSMWTDRGESAWAQARLHADTGLWAAWRADLGPGADRALGVDGLSARVLSLPARADEALAMLCRRLGLDPDAQTEAFARSLGRVPGWVSHLAELSENTGQDRVLELLTIRFALIDALDAACPVTLATSVPLSDNEVAAQVWQTALLASRRRPLLEHVHAAAAPLASSGASAGASDGASASAAPLVVDDAPVADDARALADLVFCIDVRSEPLRRALEARGEYRTFGFAGFFGVPLAFQRLDAPGASAQCPVLLQPRNTVHEQVDAGSRDAVLAGRRTRTTSAGSWHGAEAGAVTPFALAEATGPLLGLWSMARTAAPALAGRTRPLPGEGLAHAQDDLVLGFSVEEQAFLAEASLLAMGLVDAFAPVVVLVGHASTVTNNPFAAGYDCGACGGNGGAVNARTLAAVLASREVRALLAERGIVVPDDTVVLGAVHDTTRDVVTLFPPPPGAGVPDAAVLTSLQNDLRSASRAVSRQRAALLPGSSGRAAGSDAADRAHRHVAGRALDWAQVRPEWALAGNYAFVVGPRALTRSKDLQGRVFLHSYRHDVDPQGAALEVILTAPLVVAQWINSQYLAATTDPDGFGSGSKTVHNVVGQHGVVAGARGDLRPALPRQAVLVDDATPRHEPLPLMAVVHAPLERVDTIVGRHTLLQNLCGNGWVTLVVVDPEDGTMWRYEAPGRWVVDLPPRAGASVPATDAVSDPLGLKA